MATNKRKIITPYRRKQKCLTLLQIHSMKLLTKVPAWLRNKFFIAFAAFAVWMLFFDERDIFTMRHHRQELRELQQSKKYYTDQINKEKTELESLKMAATLEKYAREKYYMKRDNEDLFLIPEKQGN